MSTNASREPALETRNLTKLFGALPAVDGVDLTVKDGEFRSIIGPNGAGKTTLFNLISGKLAPTEGSIYLGGDEITDESPHARIHAGLGRSFQISNIFDGLTVAENIRLASQSPGYNELKSIKTYLQSTDQLVTTTDQTEVVLNQVGLADRRSEIAATLAHGDKRRLEIGMVLAADPDVVLLDEPTAGMGGEETSATIDLIEDVLADKTLLLVEHDIGLVMQLSDKIAVLHQGRKIADGTPAEIKKNDKVQRAYLGGHE